MRRTFLLLFACAMLTGCSCLRQTVEVPVYIHDTTNTVREIHDSTFIDRWHTIQTKGDTVYWHDSIVMYRYVLRGDTVCKYVEVPVETTITKTVEVQKQLSWWERTQRGGFWVLLAVFSLWLLWKFCKVIL